MVTLGRLTAYARGRDVDARRALVPACGRRRRRSGAVRRAGHRARPAGRSGSLLALALLGWASLGPGPPRRALAAGACWASPRSRCCSLGVLCRRVRAAGRRPGPARRAGLRGASRRRSPCRASPTASPTRTRAATSRTRTSSARPADYSFVDPLLATAARDPTSRCSSPRPERASRGCGCATPRRALIVPQFYHLWPALLATALDAGGRPALLATVPVAGVLSVLALCALLRRVGDECCSAEPGGLVAAGRRRPAARDATCCRSGRRATRRPRCSRRRCTSGRCSAWSSRCRPAGARPRRRRAARRRRLAQPGRRPAARPAVGRPRRGAARHPAAGTPARPGSRPGWRSSSRTRRCRRTTSRPATRRPTASRRCRRWRCSSAAASRPALALRIVLDGPLAAAQAALQRRRPQVVVGLLVARAPRRA